MLTGKQIATKIRRTVQQENIKYIHLGEALGIAKTARSQSKTQRYAYFLRNLEKDRLYLDDLKKVAGILKKPVEYFLLSQQQLLVLSQVNTKRVVRPTEEGSYIFIHRNDRGLLDSLVENVKLLA